MKFSTTLGFLCPLTGIPSFSTVRWFIRGMEHPVSNKTSTLCRPFLVCNIMGITGHWFLFLLFPGVSSLIGSSCFRFVAPHTRLKALFGADKEPSKNPTRPRPPIAVGPRPSLRPWRFFVAWPYVAARPLLPLVFSLRTSFRDPLRWSAPPC